MASKAPDGLLATPFKAAAVYYQLHAYRLIEEPNPLLEGLWRFVEDEKAKWSASDIQIFHELCHEAELEMTVDDARTDLAALDTLEYEDCCTECCTMCCTDGCH